MYKTYLLRDALVLNDTGVKYNAVASVAKIGEINKHKHHFKFDFAKPGQQGKTVFKLCKEGEADIWQGAVAFAPSTGILDCYNMEAASINKKPILLYNGVGKAMVALCCKVSSDLGFDGFITFEAKTKLMPYYKRLGGVNIFGLRMAIDEVNAKKLIALYF